LLGNSLPSSQFQRLAVEHCSMPGVVFLPHFVFERDRISPSQGADETYSEFGTKIG
jgi:hypothetical protein